MIENEAIKAMKTRFSCRAYDRNRPVEKEKIETIIDAAKYAASGHNQQGWYFTIITSDEGKELLLKAAGTEPTEGFKKMMPDKKWPFPADFFGAPVIIMISGRTDVPWPLAGPYLAAGNFMNAASSLGLSATWMTLYSLDLFRDEEAKSVRSKLIPDDYELRATLFLGYPEKEPGARPPRKENVERWI